MDTTNCWVMRETGLSLMERKEHKDSLSVKWIKTRSPGRQARLSNPQEEQAQKWVRKPSRQGGTSRISPTTRVRFVSWFCCGFCFTNEFLRDFSWERNPSCGQSRTGKFQERCQSPDWKEGKKRSQLKTAPTQNLFDELNSDKSPRSDGIHPITSKKFEAAALECMSKMDRLSLDIIAVKGIFVLFFSKILSTSG